MKGPRRIYLLAKYIMLFGSLAGIALLMVVQKARAGLVLPFIVIAASLACGGILWLIAWIVEGFLTSSGHSSQKAAAISHQDDL